MANIDQASLTSVPQTPAVPETLDSGEMKMKNLSLRLQEQGATFAPLSIEEGEHGCVVRAAMPIRAGALILHIPRSLMIFREQARRSRIGRLIASGTAQISDSGYMAAYVLDLKRNGGGWKAWLDALPNDFPGHPYFYDESELGLLKGSYVLPMIRERKARVEFEYSQMRSCLPQDKMFSLEDYAWARSVIASRVHTTTISGKQDVALIPLADMLHHSTEPNVDWQPESSMGMICTAARNIEAGERLAISYGTACNGYWFSRYGFCLENNPHNVAEIHLPCLPADHPNFEQAKGMGTVRKEMRVFEVRADYDHRCTRDLFSYLRLYAVPRPLKAKLDSQNPVQVGPISIENEQEALSELALACQLRLRQFDTSIEEDELLLKDQTMPLRQRNAVRVRLGEKLVLRYFLELALRAMPMPHVTTWPEKFARYFEHTRTLLGR